MNCARTCRWLRLRVWRKARALWKYNEPVLTNHGARIYKSVSGPLKKITLTTIFHGASFHQDRPTTAQTKDATSALKKNYSSFAAPNYYHSINVMSSCPHAAVETKCYCVTIEVLILCKLKYINDGTNILDYKIPWWVSNYETGLYGWKYSLSVFFSPIATYIALYFYILSIVKRKNQYTDFLYIYIYISEDIEFRKSHHSSF